MVAFEITSEYEKIIEVVLNGKNFHLKLQEILLGKGKYGNYYLTANREVDTWKVKILDIDINKEDINKYMFDLHTRAGRPQNHAYIHPATLDDHYQKLSVTQNLDFYLNLRDYYTVSKLKEIVHLYLRRNVSAKWLSVYFNIDIGEIRFLLNYLPCYYNYLEEDTYGETITGNV